jgi:hypothetical protein
MYAHAKIMNKAYPNNTPRAFNITSLISMERNPLLKKREIINWENSNPKPTAKANPKIFRGLTFARKFIPNPKGMVRTTFPNISIKQYLNNLEQY